MSLPNNIKVYDNWIEEPLKTGLIEAVNWVPMYFINRAERYNSHPLDIHWYYPVTIIEESLFGRVEDQLYQLEEPLNVILDTWNLIKNKLGGNLGLYSCSVSANTFGTEGNPHFDFQNRERAKAHITILIYCNKEWEINWAGETLFFDENNEISGGVIPKPGRVVVMYEDPYHVGRSVSRICPSDRRVLVFKLWNESLLKEILKS